MALRSGTFVPGVQREVQVRVTRQLDLARVDDNQFRAAQYRLLDACAHDWMILRGIGAAEQKPARACSMSSKELVAAPVPSIVFRAAAVGAWQTRAQQSTLLVPENEAGKLLREIILLVRSARGTEHANAVGAMGLDHALEILSREGNGLRPRDLFPVAAGPNHRFGHTVRARA